MPKNDPAGYLPAVKKARKGSADSIAKPKVGKKPRAGAAPPGFTSAAAMAKSRKKR